MTFLEKKIFFQITILHENVEAVGKSLMDFGKDLK